MVTGVERATLVAESHWEAVRLRDHHTRPASWWTRTGGPGLVKRLVRVMKSPVCIDHRLNRHNGEIVCPRCLPLQENRQRSSPIRSSAFYWGEGRFKSLLNGFSGPIGRSENVIKCASP